MTSFGKVLKKNKKRTVRDFDYEFEEEEESGVTITKHGSKKKGSHHESKKQAKHKSK